MREVLRHKSVEKVYFIEIDKEVIEVSKKFFPNVVGILPGSLQILDPVRCLEVEEEGVGR